MLAATSEGMRRLNRFEWREVGGAGIRRAAYPTIPRKAVSGSQEPAKNRVSGSISRDLGAKHKPLRISITVNHLVLNVEFQVDTMPDLRKTGP